MGMVVEIKDGDLLYIKRKLIKVKKGFNPRKYFDPDKHASNVKSIREKGILQNLIVRPDEDEPGTYWLVVGECRFRAATEIDMEELPCQYRDVNEKQAKAMASCENYQRDNLSPAEEAKDAQVTLNACEGDKEEAARVLNWSPSMLEARLLLLHADDSVLTALAERRIKLGVAELLSRLPKEIQVANLPSIIEKKYSVKDVKNRIESIAQMLSTAAFDTAGCEGCPQNSDTQGQASLFAVDIEIVAGQCTGTTCFQEKTKAVVAVKKVTLKETYNKVALDVEVIPGSTTFLLENAVGSKQYNACQSCAKFGAILSTEPGNAANEEKNICFDVQCNAKKVADNKTASKKKVVKKDKVNPAAMQEIDEASPQTVPKAVNDYANNFLRQQAADVAAIDPATVRAVTLYALLRESGKLDLIGSMVIQRHEAIAVLHKMSDVELDKIELGAVQHQLQAQKDDESALMGGLTKAAIQVLLNTETNITDRFLCSKEFLNANTMSGIEGLLKNTLNGKGDNFFDWYENKFDEGSFKKLKSKKSALIDSVLSSEFDFSGWLPTCISEKMRTMETDK